MKITLQPERKDIRHAIIIANEAWDITNQLPGLSEKLQNALKNYCTREEWEWKAGKSAVVSFADVDDAIILVGLGDAGKVDAHGLRKAVGSAIGKARALKAKKVALWLAPLEGVDNVAGLVAETAMLANYTFDKYLEKKAENLIEELVLIGAADELAIQEATYSAYGATYARDLVNEPANALLPVDLAERAKAAGECTGFDVEVFDEKVIRDELKMEAFWQVARGSDNPPRLIVMRWKGDPDNADDITALVGKGLTYDAGGYAIKTAAGMAKMKCDMGGSAAVIGAIGIIAAMKLKKNVVAVVAACENMISGHAYRNGDIIGSMAGKTIEVGNTDAEGRLTLIDAVHYAIDREKATRVVDIATLTGAALVALGNYRMGVVSNDDDFYAKLEIAAALSDEPVWRLPHDQEYRDLLKSKIADISNIGKGGAGTVTAGLFIREFVQDKPWLHLDIAGTAFVDKPGPYGPEGATGSGARLLYHLVKQL